MRFTNKKIEKNIPYENKIKKKRYLGENVRLLKNIVCIPTKKKKKENIVCIWCTCSINLESFLPKKKRKKSELEVIVDMAKRAG